jgi:hypothetical protein
MQNAMATATGVHPLRCEYARTIEPARALAAETLNLERTLSDIVGQACGLTPAENLELVVCSYLICSGGSFSR